MTEHQNKILRGFGIIFLLTAIFLLFLDFGANVWRGRIVRWVLLIAGIYFYHISEKEKRRSENRNEIRPYALMLLCAPTILGVLAIAVAELFRPGPRMPLATTADRFFVNLVVVGVPMALIGLPLVAFAIYKGALLIWRASIHSATSKLVILILVIAIGASAFTVMKTIEYRGQYRQKEKQETTNQSAGQRAGGPEQKRFTLSTIFRYNPLGFT